MATRASGRCRAATSLNAGRLGARRCRPCEVPFLKSTALQEGLIPSRRRTSPTAPTSPAISSAVMRPDGFVGRRRELDALHSWLETARSGAGRLVLCSGEAGAGKTRIAQELAGIALPAGGAVAGGRGAQAQGAPAHLPGG